MVVKLHIVYISLRIKTGGNDGFVGEMFKYGDMGWLIVLLIMITFDEVWGK